MAPVTQPPCDETRADMTQKPVLRLLQRPIVIFCATFLTLVVLGHSYLTLPPHWDALGYVYPAACEIRDHIRTPFVIGTEDTGHPTLGFWLIALVWRVQRALHLGGGPHLAAHLLMIAFSALTLVYTYRLARLALPVGTSWAAVLLLLAHPIFFAQSLQIQLDVMLMGWLAVATYYYWRGKWWKFWAAAAAMSLTKAYGAAFLLAFALFAYCDSYRLPYAQRGRHVLRWALFTLSPSVVFVLFVLLRKRMTGNYLSSPGHMSELNLSVAPSLGSYFLRYPEIFKQIFWGNGILILFLAGAAAYGLTLRQSLAAGAPSSRAASARNPLTSDRGRLLLFLFLQIPLAFFLWGFRPQSVHRFYLPIYPHLFVLGAAGLHRLFGSSRARLAAVCAVLIALSVFRWNPLWGRALPSRSLRSFLCLNEGDALTRANVSDEITLGFGDYVRAVRDAGRWLDTHQPGARIMTHYPLNHALADPDYGYVEKPFVVVGGSVDYLKDIVPGMADLYVFTSINVTSVDPVGLGRFIELRLLKRFEHGRHFVEIYQMGSTAKKRSPQPATAQ